MNKLQGELLVQVDQLAVTFFTPRGTVRAVREASLEIRRGEVLGLVGESGCGKSTTAFAIMGYLPGTAQMDGTILFEGQNIAQMNANELRNLRGNRMAMVYQDPALSLNPTMRIGTQIEEVLKEHLGMDHKAAKQRASELFESVRLADPEKIGHSYPHQLSGGMQQRVVIAMALACDPDLLIMDEPTTGLDVTTEATLLDLVVDLKHRVNAGILYVSHNLGVIARVADRVGVMYAGQTVEEAPVGEIFKNPKHPYTAGLLSCVPQPPAAWQRSLLSPYIKSGSVLKLSSIPGSVYPAARQNVDQCLFASRCPMAEATCTNEQPSMTPTSKNHNARCFFSDKVRPGIWGEAVPREKAPQRSNRKVLTAQGIRRFYGKWQRKYLLFGPRVRPPIRAVSDINFEVGLGRTLGIVGESGSGKTTVARTVVGLVPRDRGDLRLLGKQLAPAVEKRTAEEQAAMRMVFQNPTASLNPKLPVRHAILRSLRKYAKLGRVQSLERASELLESVGLNPSYLDRRPGELSGGEQQRVALAGAFSGTANIIIADEAVSALDVSVQAQVLNLLEEHQAKAGISYIFISHDLGVVRYVSDDILVLYAGHVAESGPVESVLNAPSHPYTEALLSAAPVPDPNAVPTNIRLPGAVPTLRERFQGCFFAGRCPRKIGPICDQSPPAAQVGPESPNHLIYCHIPIADLK